MASRSSCGRRRRGRCPPTSPRPCGRTPSTGAPPRASGTRSSVYQTPSSWSGLRGADLVGRPYRGPFDDLAAATEVEHRVIPWDEISLDEGTGIVHIAPGAGSEDFELGRVHGLPVLIPIDESGIFYDTYGPLAGLAAEAVEEPIVASLRERGLLVEAGRIVHRYPTCWRCKTPLLFRVVDDWFISADEIRQPMLDANATVEWTPAFYPKRMDDWLRNMGDWNISRKRYFGLPLPFYPCACGHLTVIGSHGRAGAACASRLRRAARAAPAVDRRRDHRLRACAARR